MHLQSPSGGLVPETSKLSAVNQALFAMGKDRKQRGLANATVSQLSSIDIGARKFFVVGKCPAL